MTQSISAELAKATEEINAEFGPKATPKDDAADGAPTLPAPDVWVHFFDGEPTAVRRDQEDINEYLRHMSERYPFDADRRYVDGMLTESKMLTIHEQGRQQGRAQAAARCAEICATEWATEVERLYGLECAAAIRAELGATKGDA